MCMKMSAFANAVESFGKLISAKAHTLSASIVERNRVRLFAITANPVLRGTVTLTKMITRCSMENRLCLVAVHAVIRTV
jgi:hypothetical protein